MSEADELLSMYEDMDRNDDAPPTVREEYLKPPFGWPGGKSKSIKYILPLLPYYDSYVEVFGGSGAVLLNRQASKLEVFNDRFSGVTDFYKVIRDQSTLDKLVERLEATVHSREEWIDSKSMWKDTTDIVERAAKWYYMVAYSFGAQGRNFGRGCYDGNNISGKIQNRLSSFAELHKRLRNVLVENQSWENILADFDKHNTVFYMDPPYLDSYKGMYEHDMNINDHQRLLDKIFQLKGFVAVSAYENKLYNECPWDNIQTWEVFAPSMKMAFRETNHAKELEGIAERGHAKEVLYIKEAK